MGDVALTPASTVKKDREKRTQVISYLTAKEAATAGFPRFIESYALNKYYRPQDCNTKYPDGMEKNGTGLVGEYYKGRNFDEFFFSRIDASPNFESRAELNSGRPADSQLESQFTVRWTGRIKIPKTGTYNFRTEANDGIRFYLNDVLLINDFNDNRLSDLQYAVNLEEGKSYDIKLEYLNGPADGFLRFKWQYNNSGIWDVVPTEALYPLPVPDTFNVDNVLTREQRINYFRKADHLSQINVLNNDGRRYVYGLPVYNLVQKEVTFSVDKSRGNAREGLVKYDPGKDDNTGNKQGNDHYFNGETMPAYAHSFLLTGILSPDYVDVSGDGISADDPGDAIKFNYTKVAGIKNPHRWRAPYADSATYNEGMKTDYRDDKGSYVYGEKELWYLNSVESKNMIAVFTLGERNDLAAISKEGVKSKGSAKKLERIDLYTKADLMKFGTQATPVKTVNFDYTYDLCKGVNRPLNNEGKLTLQRIWFSYNGNNKGRKNAYVFNYSKQNPGYNTKNYDRWGNYKDPLHNPGSSAGNFISNVEYPYALQDSITAAANASAWALDSIQLPSGARMKITYESDDYAYVQHKRAMQMCKVAGFSAGVPSSMNNVSNRLYGSSDYLYVAIHVPKAVNSVKEVYTRYLEGVDKIYFKMQVQMPADKFGSGYESVPCYGKLATSGGYGFFNNGRTIWVRLTGIEKDGRDGGAFSPLATAAIQFLRLNLPSKAFPGSDVGDDLDMEDGVRVLFSLGDNIKNTVRSFELNARSKGWANAVDTSRSLARLNHPYYKKYGGGLRVKRIVTYDNWKAMTNKAESVYGQEYQYTTTQMVDGVETLISSGVAAYEPILGGEENPWRQPVEFTEQVAALAPVNMGYSEEPLGETFFPSPSVGYSKVSTRTINAAGVRSANGYVENCFYTSRDFPVITDYSPLNETTKLRYKPALSNLLKVNARHFLYMTQGFKVELNDMHGKPRSVAVYAENNPNSIGYTEYFYRVDNQQAAVKHLNNTVPVISARGIIDAKAEIGKDMELMTDMREQRTLTNGLNFNVNGDFFQFYIPPVMMIPSFLNVSQREENIFRSTAATKLIHRHGILDSVVVIDKGSRVTTRNMLYDGETGEVVLTSTQNEYNDPVYNFTYPAGWMYDGMSGAYKNINVVMDNLNMLNGRITQGFTGNMNDYFSSGDELLIHSSSKTGGTDCDPSIATFPGEGRIWAVDGNLLKDGTPDIYFVGEDGKPFSGNNVSLKIIRSGRKNIGAAAGSVTMLKNPMVPGGDTYSFTLNNTSRIINAVATEYNQFWKVADKKKYVPVVVTYKSKAASGSYRKQCAEGVGTLVTYTVPAEQYTSTISPEDADWKAIMDVRLNGQKNANLKGTCSALYAKFSYGAYEPTSRTTPTEYINEEFQSISISFYTDAACTIPFTATNLTVTLNVNESWTYDWMSPGAPESRTLTYEKTYTCNGSTAVLEPRIMTNKVLHHRGFNNGMEYETGNYDYTRWTFSIKPGTGIIPK